MKINKQEQPNFRPVVVILESQEEVDQLYALFNHPLLCNLTVLPALADAYKLLKEHRSERAHDDFGRLDRAIIGNL